MADSTHVLAQLAEALGIPIEAFTRLDHPSDETVARLQETVELLDAWRRIDDCQARRRCLSYVKSAVERSTSS